jgi:CRISPR/Cas system-associated exonuclease Cas4 (RecB family)
MGRPKQNKKAEIRARRKARKAHERIADLKRREKMIKAYLKVIAENAQTLQKLADSEVQEATEEVTDISDESSPDDQSSQSPSE